MNLPAIRVSGQQTALGRARLGTAMLTSPFAKGQPSIRGLEGRLPVGMTTGIEGGVVGPELHDLSLRLGVPVQKSDALARLGSGALLKGMSPRISAERFSVDVPATGLAGIVGQLINGLLLGVLEDVSLLQRFIPVIESLSYFFAHHSSLGFAAALPAIIAIMVGGDSSAVPEPDAHIARVAKKLEDVFIQIVTPYVPQPIAGIYREAIFAYTDAAPVYWTAFNPEKPSKINLEEKQIQALIEMLAIPGIRGALGSEAVSKIVTALTGRIHNEDPIRHYFRTEFRAVAPHLDFNAGIARYHRIAPGLRTHFTSQMMHVEQVLERIIGLQSEDLPEPMLQQMPEMEINAILQRAFSDLTALVTENGLLHYLFFSNIRNALFNGERINLCRVHINMTMLNELTGTNDLGDLYIDIIKGWFQEKFGAIAVTQNPEHTTFVFRALDPTSVSSAMVSFEDDVVVRLVSAGIAVDPQALHGFKPKAIISHRFLSAGDVFNYGIETMQDIRDFSAVLEFNNGINVDQFIQIMGLQQDTVNSENLARAVSIVKQVIPEASIFIERLGIENVAELRSIFSQFNRQISVDVILRMSEQDALTVVRRLTFDINRAKSCNRKVVQKTLQALMTKAIIIATAKLAAQTEFFEKEIGYGERIYKETDLPQQGNPLYPVYQGYEARRAGYVAPGFYDPLQYSNMLLPEMLEGTFLDVGLDSDDPRRSFTMEGDLPAQVSQLLRIFPPIMRIAGEASHDRSNPDGTRNLGAMERFERSLDALKKADIHELQEVDARLRTLKRDARALLSALRNLYRWAIRDPKNALTPKHHKGFPLKRGLLIKRVPTYFFLQEVAISGNRYLLHLEYDSFKAYLEKYGVFDFDDKDFNRVKDCVFEAAVVMTMQLPIMSPAGGDHIAVSFAHKDKHGQDIDPMVFARLVQSLVKQKFSDRVFHDKRKVDMREWRLEGVNASAFSIEGLRESLRLSLGSRTQPEVTGSGENYVVLAVPLVDSQNNDIDVVNDVQRALSSQSIFVEDIRYWGMEKLRLPMWIPMDAYSPSMDDMVFGRSQPRGYSPFKNRLTVTIAVGEHRPITSEWDKQYFLEIDDHVSRALGEAKEGSLPNKEGLVDVRSWVPVHGSDSPDITTQLITIPLSHALTKIGLVRSAQVYIHPLAEAVGNVVARFINGVLKLFRVPPKDE